MAYRYQVVSVGMWRGKIKRWNTTFHYADQFSTNTLYNKMQSAGWKNSGDAVGACSGGVASITVYASTGGTPVSQTVYFDWQTPTTWVPYTGTLWAGVDPLTPLDAAGESALVVVGHMSALSSTGKPITTRKYFHHVPSRTGTDYTAPDVPAAVVTAFAQAFTPQWMLNPAGAAPYQVTAENYYGSHQRVRGRRRTVTQVAAQSFSAGVVVGSEATGSGTTSAQFR